MTFWKIARLTLGGAAVIAVAIQCVRPARTNPASDPSMALAARIQVPADVAAILDRSCRDCHSNDTRWPWYTNVAPVSWWVIDHVNHGRSHFNFSEWAKYNSEEQQKLLKQACELSRKREMPLPSYLLMHDAAMSAKDVRDSLRLYSNPNGPRQTSKPLTKGSASGEKRRQKSFIRLTSAIFCPLIL